MEKGIDPNTLTPEDLVERWLEFLDLTKSEALGFYDTRRTLENVEAMFQTNSELKDCGGDVHHWLANLHVSHFLVCIRRELEKGGGHPTLVNLLFEMERHAQTVLTRKRYVALYNESTLSDPKWGNEHFDKKPGAVSALPKASPDSDYISPDFFRGRREALLAHADSVLKYANWMILHRTKAKPSDVTWGDVYRVMDEIFETYAACYNLLTASVWVNRYPVPQYDHLAPFRFAWIADGFKEWQSPD